MVLHPQIPSFNIPARDIDSRVNPAGLLVWNQDEPRQGRVLVFDLDGQLMPVEGEAPEIQGSEKASSHSEFEVVVGLLFHFDGVCVAVNEVVVDEWGVPSGIEQEKEV